MTPIPFKEQTVTIAENQPQYLPFPAHRFRDDANGRIAACWKLSFIERIKVLLTGVVWQQVMTFGKPLQPQLLSIDKPYMT